MSKIVIARHNILGRIFFQQRYLKLQNSEITLEPSQVTIKINALQNFVTTKSLPWGNRIFIPAGENSLTMGLLLKSGCEEIAEAINTCFAKTLEIRILGVLDYFNQAAEKIYLRDSQILNLQHEVISIISDFEQSSEIWRDYLAADLIDGLSTLKRFLPVESHAQELRSRYEVRVQDEYSEFFSNVENNPLNSQQRLAVVRDNDLNLILAGAGTGKTSVIIAKALFLQKTRQARATDILILAYNKKAAQELKERYESGTKAIDFDITDTPTIKTFHALGLDVLKEVNEKISISMLQTDSVKLLMWVTDWLRSFIDESDTGLPDFIKILYEPINPFEFETREEYEHYLRDNEYRTFKGDLVKSYQEVIIANWLFEHSIQYVYEPQYQTKARIEVGIDYRPDFFLPEFDTYLEHFGIDRYGQTRADIDAKKYGEQMESKRALHKEQGTHLIETYHYEWCEGVLFDLLTEKLQAIIFNQERDGGCKYADSASIDKECEWVLWQPVRRPREEILLALNEMGLVSKKAEILLDCLAAIRVEDIHHDAVLTRLQDRKIGFSDIWAKILNKLVDDYLSELRRTQTIDFDDMIVRASSAMMLKQYKPQWTHILVDEFQDISNARMNFLRELVSSDKKPSLSVVGDDWQAIYRFSGGKLELTTQFEKLVGKNTMSKLETTYRYNDNIAHVAGTFVMQNPGQYVKTISSQIKVDSPKVFLLDESIGEDNSLVKKVSTTIATLRNNTPDESIAILARYNYLLQECRDYNRRQGIRDVHYWTFHGSKGLEADNCIIIGFLQGGSGFPNYKQDSAVKEALLPLEDSYPHSEERRLLYVALTRAKNRSYLIANATAPSEFILELLAPKYGLRIVSDRFEERYQRMFKCSNCPLGYIVTRNGPYGEFYSCSTGSSCKVKPRKCIKCGAPSLDDRNTSTCNNRECNYSMKICPKCGRPMWLKEGRFGQFWGCSGYGRKDDKCTHTEKTSA
jgi:DNA helicase-4